MHLLRQQAALEGQRGLPLAPVEPGVVQRQRGAGDQFLGEGDVGGAERLGVAHPDELGSAEHHAPGGDRHHQVGVDARRDPGGHPVLAGDQPAQHLLVHVGPQQRLPAAQALGVAAVGGVLGGLADDVDGVHEAALVGLPDGDGAQGDGPVGGDLGGLGAAQHRLQQVDGGEVREPGDDGLDQFLGGALEVEGGADPRRRLGDGGEAFLGPGGAGLGLEAFGDVDDRGTDAEDPAGGVLQPEVGGGPRAVPPRIAGDAAVRAGVHHRLPGLQHLSHGLFDLGAVDAGQHGGYPAAEVGGGRHAVHPGERLVDPDVAQVGVVDRHAYRRAAEDAVQHRQVGLDGMQGAGVGGGGEQQQGVGRAGDRVGAELQVDLVAVAVADREDAGPAGAAHDPFEEVEHLGAVAAVGEQLGGEAADGLLGGVAEQGLGVLAPVQDQSVVLKQGCRERDEPVAFGASALGTGRRAAPCRAGGGGRVPLVSVHDQAAPRFGSCPAGWASRSVSAGVLLQTARTSAARRPLGQGLSGRSLCTGVMGVPAAAYSPERPPTAGSLRIVGGCRR